MEVGRKHIFTIYKNVLEVCKNASLLFFFVSLEYTTILLTCVEKNSNETKFFGEISLTIFGIGNENSWNF